MFHKKQIFKVNVLKNLLNDENSCVSLVPSTRLLALPPFFLNDMKSGILHQLNTLLKKYDRSLDGIVIGYQNIKVLMDDNTGIIPIGSSETEVNISVEFYIFQPKIGSYLEGVINKKSNAHIGCLVHQHFNATILKPEDVEYEDWNCKNLKVDDKIIFKVKDLDFTTLLPYIEGVFDGGNFVDNVNIKSSQNCDINNVIAKDVSTFKDKAAVPKELLKSKTKSNKIFEHDFLNNKEKESENKKESILKGSISCNLEGSDSFTDKAVKKKKKKKKEKMEHSNKVEEKRNQCLPSEEMESNVLCSTQLEPDLSERMMISFCSPIHQDSPFKSKVNIKKLNLESSPHSDDQGDTDRKKAEVKAQQKNQKRKEKESSKDTPDLKKFKTSHSSLFPKEDTKENVNGNEVKSLLKNLMKEMFSEQLNKVKEELNKSLLNKESYREEKKKHKNKKKDQDESVAVSKNEKFANEGDDAKSKVQSMLNELCQLQMQRVKEELNISDREIIKESKKKKVKEKKLENEISKNETKIHLNHGVDKKFKRKKKFSLSDGESVTESKKKKNKREDEEKTADILINGDDKTSEVEDTMNELCRLQLERVREELSILDRENIKEKKKKKTKIKKGETEVWKEKTRDEPIHLDDKKSEQNKIDILSKFQLERVEHEPNISDRKNLKESKKKKVKINKDENEVSKQKTKDEMINEGDRKSEVQDSLDELCRLQLQRVKEELSMSDRDSLKEIKKKKYGRKTGDDKVVKEKTEDESVHVDSGKSEENTIDKQSKLQLQKTDQELGMSDRESLKHSKKIKVKVKKHESSKKKTKDNPIDGNDKKSEIQSTLDELYRLQLQRVKEELRVSDRESIKESKKKKVKENKHENEASKEKIKDKTKKYKNVQNRNLNESETSNQQGKSGDLYKQVINKITNKSDNTREKKKKKSASEKQDASMDETNDSLYYELLKEAKISMDLG